MGRVKTISQPHLLKKARKIAVMEPMVLCGRIRNGGISMMQHRIKLRPDEVKKFVAAATRCAFDVDISYNSFVVDAKSILGVLGLNFNQVLTVAYNGYDADFERYLQKFAVAC